MPIGRPAKIAVVAEQVAPFRGRRLSILSTEKHSAKISTKFSTDTLLMQGGRLANHAAGPASDSNAAQRRLVLYA